MERLSMGPLVSRLRSVRHWVKGVAFIRYVDGHCIRRRRQGNLDLVLVVVVTVVHDIEHELFQHQVNSKQEVRRPLLLLCKGLNGFSYLVQLLAV